MKVLRLKKGSEVLMDNEDFSLISQLPWHIAKGYARTSTKTKKFKRLFPHWDGKALGVYMHQLVLGLSIDLDIDHHDGHTLNNQKFNLRLATRSQNIGNSVSNVGTSKYKGVYFSSRKGRADSWVAEITLHRAKRYLGAFQLEVDAARAYDRAAFLLFGPYARFNFPEDAQRENCLPNPRRPGHEFIGVRPQNSKYSARIDDKHLGVFDSAYDAALYRDFHIEKHNLTSRMNF